VKLTPDSFLTGPHGGKLRLHITHTILKVINTQNFSIVSYAQKTHHLENLIRSRPQVKRTYLVGFDFSISVTKLSPGQRCAE
jgi:hypothetical protein